MRVQNDISIFLDVANAEFLPLDWEIQGEFEIELINQREREKGIVHVGTHRFNAKEHDRGFLDFTGGRRSAILGPKSEYLTKNRELEFRVAVTVTPTPLDAYVFTEDDMRAHRGSDLLDIAHAKSVPWNSTILSHLEDLKRRDKSYLHGRVWRLARRFNSTLRPDYIFPEANLSEQFAPSSATLEKTCVWIERPPLVRWNESDVLIFIKWFDPLSNTLMFLSKLAIAKTAQVSRICTLVQTILNLEVPDVLLWLEASPVSIGTCLSSFSRVGSRETRR